MRWARRKVLEPKAVVATPPLANPVPGPRGFVRGARNRNGVHMPRCRAPGTGSPPDLIGDTSNRIFLGEEGGDEMR